MKTIKVGINGFGRIGRAFLKVAWDKPEIEIVAVNDLGDIANMAYLLKHDTVYRDWDHKITVAEDSLVIDGKKVKVSWEPFDVSLTYWMEDNLIKGMREPDIISHNNNWNNPPFFNSFYRWEIL